MGSQDAGADGSRHDVVLVGAGIVGLASAHKLQEAGRAVTLVDERGIANRASAGNAGALAYSDILPLSARGLFWKAPAWLADPLGPLAIPPAYAARIMPWLWRFWRAGSAKTARRGTAAQAAMVRLARPEMTALVTACRLGPMIFRDGSVELYESEREFRGSLTGWQLRQSEGIDFEHVSGTCLSDLQPGLSPRFVAGTFVPGWETVADPQLFARAIADTVLARIG
ncbi:FAD-dependent oxidoreductase [Jiella mangrovi]|uniref:FAD-dependent oxidoreductase n=1 Tax=Jiella mangrovi TaxID=2821407 RepID=UPI001FD7530F|nr:FAD-dependent oxidoreductase [Jiella mangrovi]